MELKCFDFPKLIVNNVGDVWAFENALSTHSAYYSNPSMGLRMLIVDANDIGEDINKDRNKYYRLK